MEHEPQTGVGAGHARDIRANVGVRLGNNTYPESDLVKQLDKYKNYFFRARYRFEPDSRGNIDNGVVFWRVNSEVSFLWLQSILILAIRSHNRIIENMSEGVKSAFQNLEHLITSLLLRQMKA